MYNTNNNTHISNNKMHNNKTIKNGNTEHTHKMNKMSMKNNNKK